jgi:hypothetical protein
MDKPKIERQVSLVEQASVLPSLIASFLTGWVITSARPWLMFICILALVLLLLFLPFTKSHLLSLLDKAHMTEIERVSEEAERVKHALLEEIQFLKGQLVSAEDRERVSASQRRILFTCIEGISDRLRDCIREVKKINDSELQLLAGGDLEAAHRLHLNTVDFVKTISRRALYNLREMLNQPDDARIENRDARATYFRLTNRNPGSYLLKQYAYAYPPSSSPRTQEISQREHPGAGVFTCITTEDMFVQPDILDAYAQSEQRHSPVGWEDFRPGHHLEYGSMVCLPVISGEPRTDDRSFVGVVTITVKPRKFFQTDQPMDYPSDSLQKAFSATVLHPFPLIMALLHELEVSSGMIERITDQLS